LTNQERAKDLCDRLFRLGKHLDAKVVFDPEGMVLTALTDAEMRGYDEATAKVERMIDHIARAICLSEFGDEKTHGPARCCPVGGSDGCCVKSLYSAAHAVIKVIREPIEK